MRLGRTLLCYKEAMRGADLKIPKVWKFVIKYISPTYLLVIFALWCIDPENLRKYWGTLTQNPVAKYSMILIIVVTVFIGLLVHIASRRWDKHGFGDGEPPDMEPSS